MAAMKWLLDSDPSIRWQVMRDLLHEREDVIAAERTRVAREGWGAQLLDAQTADGYWATDPEERDTWLGTTYILVLLKDLGVDPADERVRRMIELLQERVTWWQLGDEPYFEGETEACVNGAVLAIGAYFGHPNDRLLERLLSEQKDDGGWNCETASHCSSFHPTICVLEGLLEYEHARGATPAVTHARNRAHEYLLERHMFRSKTTGEVIDRKWLRYSFPPTWRYDVLRGLDYLRKAGVRDERTAEAVELVRKRAHQNGRWPLNVAYRDLISFDMEPGVGKASRWNTLRALRVLQWFEAS